MVQTDRDCYDSVIEQLEAVQPDEMRAPGMPAESLAKEGSMLYAWVQEDLDKFKAVNFDMSTIDNLIAFAGALRFTEAQWGNRRLMQEDALKEWNEIRPVAEELKDDALDAFEYAFDGHPDLEKAISEIRDGDSAGDLVVDCPQIVDLGRKNAE